MEERTKIHVGLDVYEDNISVAAAKPGRAGELTKVWNVVDEDPETNVAIIRAAGSAFFADGDFSMIGRIMDDYTMQAAAVKESASFAYNMINCSKPIVSADGNTRFGLAAGDYAAMIWPLLCDMAKPSTTC